MKRIYITTSPEEAAFLQMALRRHGIESILEGLDASGGFPEPAIPITLSVADADVDGAGTAIFEALAARRSSGAAGGQVERS
jgi:hypothetical protein